MPSFRDLRGREVDEVVGRRDVPVDAGDQLVERGEVKAAVEKLRALKPPRMTTTELRLTSPTPAMAVPLPPDLEAGFDELEAALAGLAELSGQLLEAVSRARGQVAAVRTRALQDAVKMAKVQAVVEALKED